MKYLDKSKVKGVGDNKNQMIIELKLKELQEER